MKILNNQQIRQKIKRLAIEIVEHNYRESEVILVGINHTGYHFAELLMAELRQLHYTETTFSLTRLRVKPANPLSSPIEIERPIETLAGKAIIIVDDVANTGRTIFYACKPIFEILPKKVEVAVLINRTHKSFPVRVDYVGLSLATTLKDNIEVKIMDAEEYAVYLE